MTLATHIRDKQSKLTHPCLPLCPQPLLSDNTKLELRFPSGCTDLSTKITLCIVLIAVMILCFPAACPSRPSQHLDLMSSLQQVLREVWLLHSQSTNIFSHLPQQPWKSDCLGLILFPPFIYKLPALGRVTKPSKPWLSLNISFVNLIGITRLTNEICDSVNVI